MKNYIYRTCDDERDFLDLASAVTAASESLREDVPSDVKLTTPIVTKTDGGYFVTMLDYFGEVYQTSIDVFEADSVKPIKFFMAKTKYRGFDEPSDATVADDDE